MAAQSRTLGEALFSQRVLLGVTQEEAARELGITQGNYSRWERDLTEPREASSFERLSEFLGISIKSVVGLVAESVLQRVLQEITEVRKR